MQYDDSQDSQELTVADEVRDNVYDYSDPEENGYDFEDGFLVDDSIEVPNVRHLDDTSEMPNAGREEGITLLTADALAAAESAGRPSRARRVPDRYAPSVAGSLLSSDDDVAESESTMFGSPCSEDRSYTSHSSGGDSAGDSDNSPPTKRPKRSMSPSAAPPTTPPPLTSTRPKEPRSC